MDLTKDAIEQVIATIWGRFDEPLPLDQLVDTAIVDEHCFPRVFRSLTGTSPDGFLTAVRLSRAKELLLQTSSSVAEVASRVGYRCPEEFAGRFGRSVGVSPAGYRARGRAGAHVLTRRSRGGPAGSGVMTGVAAVPRAAAASRTYVGLFPSSVIEGVPVAYAVLDGAGRYALNGVPSGTWCLCAATVATEEADLCPWARRPEFRALAGGVTVGPGADAIELDVVLRPVTILDPPLLTVLPELDNWGRPPVREPEPSSARPGP